MLNRKHSFAASFSLTVVAFGVTRRRRTPDERGHKNDLQPVPDISVAHLNVSGRIRAAGRYRSARVTRPQHCPLAECIITRQRERWLMCRQIRTKKISPNATSARKANEVIPANGAHWQGHFIKVRLIPGGLLRRVLDGIKEGTGVFFSGIFGHLHCRLVMEVEGRSRHWLRFLLTPQP